MAMIAYIVFTILGLFKLVLIVTIISSWLISFGVINRNNKFVSSILNVCYELTEPVLRPIRNVLPSFGGLDLSPLVVFIGIGALEIGLRTYVFQGIYIR